MPPESSTTELRVPGGFTDEDATEAAMRAYTEAVGVDIDWGSAVLVDTDSGEIERRHADPDDSLNAFATLVLRNGRLVALRFSMAL